jgi:hypothetical protein
VQVGVHFAHDRQQVNARARAGPCWIGELRRPTRRYVTYTDYFVEHEAQAFLHDLHERLRSFELALHPDKTRLIRFGRHAAEQRASLREGKPEIGVIEEDT